MKAPMQLGRPPCPAVAPQSGSPRPDGIGAFLHPERRVKSEVVLGMGE